MTRTSLPGDLHPKVVAFLTIIGGPGIVILVLGLLLGDDTLKTAGITALVATVAGGAAGYKAPPAEVETTIGPASDDQLAPDAAAHIAHATAELEPDS